MNFSATCSSGCEAVSQRASEHSRESRESDWGGSQHAPFTLLLHRAAAALAQISTTPSRHEFLLPHLLPRLPVQRQHDKTKGAPVHVTDLWGRWRWWVRMAVRGSRWQSGSQRLARRAGVDGWTQGWTTGPGGWRLLGVCSHSNKIKSNGHWRTDVFISSQLNCLRAEPASSSGCPKPVCNATAAASPGATYWWQAATAAAPRRHSQLEAGVPSVPPSAPSSSIRLIWHSLAAQQANLLLQAEPAQPAGLWCTPPLPALRPLSPAGSACCLGAGCPLQKRWTALPRRRREWPQASPAHAKMF